MNDRRIARRFEMSLPVIFRSTVSEEAHSGTGKTRNISSHGLYFVIDIDLSDGTEMNLKMILPAGTRGSEVFIRATGKVIRVDNLSGRVAQQVGVAAAFKTYEIVRSMPDIA